MFIQSVNLRVILIIYAMNYNKFGKKQQDCLFSFDCYLYDIVIGTIKFPEMVDIHDESLKKLG